jgi:drug/metabolite transporter (DMT)-like permease
MAATVSLRRRPWAIGAAILGVAMLAVYVALNIAQGNTSWFEVPPWALLMATGSALAFASAQVADRRMSRNLLFGAAALFGLIGVLSLFSIGLGFVLAAAVAVVGVIRLSSEKGNRDSTEQ